MPTLLRVTTPLNLYIGLVLLRLCFALFGTGYIHPDEYFQNGEIAAKQVLGLHAQSTWEWDPVFPCRSIVPVWITTGIPLTLAKVFAGGGQLSPRLIFAAERFSFFASSFVLDYVVYYLVQESLRMPALILLGSSFVVHTFQVRPFSNSIEAVLVALSLRFLRRLFELENAKSSVLKASVVLSSLAFVAVCGLFTRITFAAFFLPLAFDILKWSLRQSRFSLRSWIRLITPSLLVAVVTAFGFAYADTAYFTFPFRTSVLELTPLNFLRYNLLPSNLAEHGLHPRWLHLVVNLPMIATPGLLIYVLLAEWDLYSPRTQEKSVEKGQERRGVIESMQNALYWLRWSSTTLLSIQPHQEPRFLIPLIVPMITFVVNNGRILRAGRLFWITWLIFNAALAVLFGILHQGGVVPSLFRVHDIIYNTASAPSEGFHVVYWKTYMPPRHLLAIPPKDVEGKAVNVTDFAGGLPETVIAGLQASSNSTVLSTILVAPFHSLRRFNDHHVKCFTERARVFPHVDLDHIEEAVEIGWKDGLSLGIFNVDKICLNGVGQ